MRIPLSRPDIGEREIEYVIETLRSGQLSLGPRLEEFEEKFAEYAGTHYAVATNSGTSALHLSVKALGIGPGDEAITSSFSFVASANCLLYEGAVPVFADIDSVTLNLDPGRVREIIEHHYAWDPKMCRLVNRMSGGALKAILPVHVFGLPCEMGPILEIAREFNLRVLEDACEALGARYHSQRVGTFGDAAAFAFYPNKQMTTAEGGMIVTNNAQIARLCRSLRNQGRDENSEWLRHVRLGYNYRLSDLHCALGLAQLERVGELISARARVAAAYANALSGSPQLALPQVLTGIERSWFVYVIQLQGPSAHPRRDKLMAALHERGMASQVYFSPIHRQPYFRENCGADCGDLPHTESASARCLALPFFSSMTEEEVAEVCAVVREFLAETREHVVTKEDKFSTPLRSAH